MQFNMENFFIYLDKELPSGWPDITEEHWQSLTQSTVKLKPLEKLKEIKCLIDKQDPDVLILSEVGGKESLENFNRLFLNERYKVELIEGNSDRGIDIGYLIKASLGLDFLLISHKERPLNFLYDHEKEGNKKSHYFSRDVAELRLFDNSVNHSPQLIILGVHLKSKLDREGVDPDGRSRRAAEVKTLMDIYEEVKRETADKIPILITGDFNGTANSHRMEAEFQPIYNNTGLKDVMEIKNVPEDKRFSQVIFNSLNRAVPVQIDYFFIGTKFSERIEQAFTYRFTDEGGLEIPPPQNIEQRNSLPSDHYPLICDLLLNDI